MPVSRMRMALCVALALALPLLATTALAQTTSGQTTPSDLRQIRQSLQEIRSRYRSKKWAESADLLLRIKKTFTHSAPQLLTRVSPEELSRFSYSLATLEEGLMAKDLGQLEQGFKLTKVATHQLESRFPDDLSRELDDLSDVVERAAALAGQVDLSQAQDHLEDIAAARLRLDNACTAVGRELWVHFELSADDLARAIRTRNAGLTRDASASAVQDLSELKDRIRKR